MIAAAPLATLFLDFDGVLHPDGCPQHRHFSHLPGLEDLLREHSYVDLVISSTWRLNRSFGAITQLFSPDIACRVVGQTPQFRDINPVPERFRSYPRHAECWAWQREHRSASDRWIALDDRPWLFRPFFERLVTCDSATGLEEAALDSLSQRLKGLPW